ncbi:betaine--homocysteine S-methyltransferase 1-like isoform X2 [Macrobrachium nipponense]|uniref:betaine--homocysteine S-methyltransferase 1-like isoform X2 n=1 Tax=Macrobrachium nipponense TaxID=159736 RepID=UPI0030C849FD
MGKKGLLERLQEGVVIGDGGFVIALEKRGYVTGGPWTPEAVLENPEAVRQLHREFLRAGSDVMQTFTFYSTDDKLNLGGNQAGRDFTCSQINEAACHIAREVASEGDALVAGGVTQCPSYTQGKAKEAIQRQVREQVEAFIANKIDFIICEFFMHVEEMEWVIEEVKKSGMPVAATMCIGIAGDHSGVSAGECAVRMAKAGADVAMEPRVITRFDVHKYAREAYDLGVRYIGGCCGFEAYHIRAIAEELAEERGKLPPASAKHKPWGGFNQLSSYSFIRERTGRDYWEPLVPNSGRPKPPTYELNTKPMS